MGTRLLQKQDIVKQKSIERKLEIDEGVKLARKIDSLRETSAGEETKLSKFREQSLRLIKEEIEDRLIERDSLDVEVRSLKERRIELQKPLDEEWLKVNSKQEELIQYAQALQAESIKLNLLSIELVDKKIELEVQSERIEERNIQSLRQSAQVDEAKTKVDNLLKEIEIKSKEKEEEFKQTNKYLLSEEARIRVMEREVNMKLENIEKREEEVKRKYILLEDREATLDRELKRRK